MGILNVTPDSFSDGGLHDDASRAVRYGLSMVENGADLVDVGGESSRPGAMPVDEATELARVVPVVAALAPHVRVCGVAPGLMYLSGPQTADNFHQAASANLMRRPTDPLDVAKTCLFLASTPSIAGTTLCVDNGQHLVPLPRDIMFVVDDLLKKSAL